MESKPLTATAKYELSVYDRAFSFLINQSEIILRSTLTAQI